MIEKHKVDSELITAIKSFYVNPESEVQIAGKTSFKLNTGVRQGCILSPLLFIILMDSISIECISPWNCKQIQLLMLSFVDDLVVFGKIKEI